MAAFAAGLVIGASLMLLFIKRRISSQLGAVQDHMEAIEQLEVDQSEENKS